MPAELSECLARFGHEDFDHARLDAGAMGQCPVRRCSASLDHINYGSQKDGHRKVPWCPEHGVRMHSTTFVHWNWLRRNDESRFRNFIVGHDLVRAIALPKEMKVEAHRVGSERSEDALCWILFTGLVIGSGAQKGRTVTESSDRSRARP